jgi:uncharacterized protein (TIGR00369 family)
MKRGIKMDNPNTFSKNIGIIITEKHDGYAKTELVIENFHLNPDGIVHGGVYATIADTAIGNAVHSTLNKGEIAHTIELNVHFLKACKEGKIIAEGKVERRGRKIIYAKGIMYSESKDIYAEADGLWYVVFTNLEDK